jgi:hypothetical protein
MTLFGHQRCTTWQQESGWPHNAADQNWVRGTSSALKRKICKELCTQTEKI